MLTWQRCCLTEKVAQKVRGWTPAGDQLLGEALAVPLTLGEALRGAAAGRAALQPAVQCSVVPSWTQLGCARLCCQAGQQACVWQVPGAL